MSRNQHRHSHSTSSGSVTSGVSAFTSYTYPASTASNYTQHTQYDDSVTEEQYTFQEQAPAYALPCEFYAIGGCETSFEYNDIDAWIEHILVVHLQDKLPSRVDCWFCTTYSFNFKDTRAQGDRRLNFENRMYHIRTHIADGKTANEMMPDFHMLDHLLKHNLISEGRFNEVRRWHGLPCPREHLKGFHKPDFVPPEKHRQAERSVMVPVDNAKDDRQRRREKKKR
ncbi:hypothetical protein F5B19DRAFT_103586 [Rostrohypoxylon terebratum]|nr:hypothetical protein F5B19DRAFT_103586 [Rostrohypoxylon terebratum]